MDSFDAEKSVNQLITIFTSIPRIYEQNEVNITMYDQESNDLIHEFEILEFNSSKGYKMAKDFKTNRLRRRKCKDQNEMLKELYYLIRRNDKLLEEFKKCQAEMRVTKNILAKRVYKPRIKTELKQVFIDASRQGAATK